MANLMSLSALDFSSLLIVLYSNVLCIFLSASMALPEVDSSSCSSFGLLRSVLVGVEGGSFVPFTCSCPGAWYLSLSCSVVLGLCGAIGMLSGVVCLFFGVLWSTLIAANGSPPSSSASLQSAFGAI